MDPWTETDDSIFEELAFEIADDVPNKWEIIASKLQRPATELQLRDRYQALLRDLWLIGRGDLTRASFKPAAGGPVSGGNGPAGGSGGAEPAGGSGGAEPSGSAEMKGRKKNK